MMLQHTANHLAAQGRNGDSMLMHVTPHEVAGLQALAQQHGKSLTTNPHTGLPEASVLDSFLPAIAGFALDTFLPGAGEAVGGALGLSGAAGTAGIVGGLAGLSSGSLEKGIMAGLGAYGGASLSSGLGAMGSDVNTRAANAAFDANNPAMDAERTAAIQAAAKPDISAGFGAAAAHPMDFLKNNKFAIGAAALPALAGLTTTPGASPTPLKNTGYYRRYATDPVTGASYQVEAVPVDEWGTRPTMSIGGVGQPVKYAAGGGVAGTHLVYNPTTKKYDTVDASGQPVGPVSIGGVGASTNVTDPTDTRSDSQKAYDYLMGKTDDQNRKYENPMLFYHQQKPNAPLPPLDLETRTGGHYVLNEAGTGYDWVPDAAGAAAPAAGLEALNAKNTASPKGGNSRYDTSLDGPPAPAMSPTAAAIWAKENPLLALPGRIISDWGVRLGLPNAQTYADAYRGIIPKLNEAGIENGNPLAGGPLDDNYRGKTFETPVTTPSPEGRGAYVPSRDSAAPASTRVAAINPSQTVDPAQASQQNAAAAAAAQQAADNSADRESRDAATHDSGIGRGEGGADSAGEHGAGGPGFSYGGIAALAGGGLGSLGGYSDGGQLLKGPGDGVSDSIPATIGHGQPARLADGEFVIPARIVSELGNGSTEAGAKQLYAMMARIQAGRAKTTGKNKVATDSKADRHLPA